MIGILLGRGHPCVADDHNVDIRVSSRVCRNSFSTQIIDTPKAAIWIVSANDRLPTQLRTTSGPMLDGRFPSGVLSGLMRPFGGWSSAQLAPNAVALGVEEIGARVRLSEPVAETLQPFGHDICPSCDR